MIRKLKWMPGMPAVGSPTNSAMPAPSAAFAQNADPKYAATCAPIAKNATYPRSSSPAKPTTTFRPSAMIT